MRKNVFFLARNFEQEGTELTEKPATRLCFLRYLLFIIWLRPDGRAASSAPPRAIISPRHCNANLAASLNLARARRGPRPRLDRCRIGPAADRFCSGGVWQSAAGESAAPVFP